MAMIEIPTEFSDEHVEQHARESRSLVFHVIAAEDDHVESELFETPKAECPMQDENVKSSMSSSTAVSLAELIDIAQARADSQHPDVEASPSISEGVGYNGQDHLQRALELADMNLGHVTQCSPALTNNSHHEMVIIHGDEVWGDPNDTTQTDVLKHSPPDEVIKDQDRIITPTVFSRGKNTKSNQSPLKLSPPQPRRSSWQLKEGDPGATHERENGIVSVPPSAATTPIRSPLHKVLKSTRQYLEEIGAFTTLNPRDTWLPVTESRNGNAWYAGFHNMNASLGFQAILLPVAFTSLGWERGIFALTVAFAWQMYTIWLLIRMHECVPGKRYNRYLELCQAAFGEKLGLVIGIPIIFQLTVGTSTALIGIGGSSLKLFYLTVCPTCANPFSLIAWYLTFAILCGVVSQLPNLNSIAGVSLVGAIMSVGYLTMVWVLSVSIPLPDNVKVTYNVRAPGGTLADSFSILNALGIIAFAFRGHNLVPEIQATMPSTLKHPAHVPMWRGARVAYVLVAFCYFPIAIGGYCAYGDLMNPQGILTSLFQFHHANISRTVLGTTYLFVVLSSISSFQIYSMSAWDLTEMLYMYRKNRPMKQLRRSMDRIIYIAISYLVAIAFPFIADLAGFFAGIGSVPATFALPCFMFLALKKVKPQSMLWYLNWTLGLLGLLLGVGFSTGAVYNLVKSGMKFRFFKPQG